MAADPKKINCKEGFMGKTIVGFVKCSIMVLAAAVLALVCPSCSLFGSQTQSAPYVAVSQTEIRVEVGQSVRLVAVSGDGSPVEWYSDEEWIAAVEGGVVTGVTAGTTTVTAASDSALATCTVTVVEPTSSETLVLSLASLTLQAGESVMLNARSSTGETVTWESSRPEVATAVNGKVTAVSAGTAVISASTRSARAECTVCVTDGSSAQKAGYRLVWNDEFDGASLDTDKWSYQTGTQDVYGGSVGPQYWGNGELQYYTDGANVKVSGGVLEITAKRESMGDRSFTSSRIVTRDKAYWTYGYFEAKIKLPAESGMWPAFWMLPQPADKTGSDNVYGGWPANGEIDIMEAKGRLLDKVDTTLHYGGTWQTHEYKSKETVLSSAIDEWHIYAVEWTADHIAWIVDGEEVFRVGSSEWWTSASQSASAPFDQPFYLLLNLAVGGQYDGYTQPDADFVSSSMSVDYVRVYEAVA